MSLDVSLFERLVRQGNLPVHQMLVQRRMRPSIAELIRSTIYPDLVDADCVKHYPDVAGACSRHGMVHQVTAAIEGQLLVVRRLRSASAK